MKQPAQTNTASAHILIADDEAPVRNALSRMLRNAGYAVALAEDGVQALEHFHSNPVDLVLSDVRMPNLDGPTLLQRVREKNEDIPFILLTGAPSVDSAMSAIRYHATDYLPKPIENAQLLEAVERAIRLHDLARVRREALALYEKQGRGSGQPSNLAQNFDRGLEALFMVYQPIIDWQRRAVFGFEALVRSSETSMPHPGALFDAAEHLSRLDDLGRAIRNRCSAPMDRAHPDAALFVNLHTQDLLDDTLFDAHAPLSKIAHRVILEITERAHIEKVADVQRRVARLRDLGFRIAIDDIGAGYSGLNSFAVVQPDVVKLDIALVRGIDGDVMKQKLVRALLSLCTDLEITVVAEGVETPAERDMVVSLGCTLLQGYLFARPGPAFPEAKF